MLSSLIIDNELFESINYTDVPIEMKTKIFNLLILLRRQRDQHEEITKNKGRLVMGGSRTKVGDDVFDMYAAVRTSHRLFDSSIIEWSCIWQQLGNVSLGQLSYIHNAKAEEETYVKFPQSFPADLFPGYKGGTISRLKQTLYCSKSAPT